MGHSRKVLPPTRISEWLVSSEVRDGLEALESQLTRRLIRHAPQPVRTRPELVARGGKRLRATLVLLGGSFGRRRDELLPAAMIPELLHTGSLIQDDIMDRADRRRGATSLHRVLGARAASLFATRVYCAAFGIVTGLSVDVRDRAVQAARDLCLGQSRELLSEGNPRVTPADCHRIIGEKTASLFAVSAWLGARVSGASPPHVRALEHYGQQFGLLYQVVDDLMDLFGDERDIGKPTGGDLQRRLFTLPVVYWLEERAGHPLARNLLRGASLTAGQCRAIACDLRDSVAIERVLSDIAAWTEGAESSLCSLPAGAARESLRRLLFSVSDLSRGLVSRSRPRANAPRSDAALSSNVGGPDRLDGPAVSLAALLPDPRRPARQATEWPEFCRRLSLELPWYGNALRAVEQQVQRRIVRIDPALVDHLQRHRRSATIAEGLAATTPVLFGGGDARQVNVAVAVALLLAAEHYQRGLDGDRHHRPGRMLAADFLLCEFMSVLCQLPSGPAHRMALAAEDYTTRIAAGDEAPRWPRFAALRRLALVAWDVAAGFERAPALATPARNEIHDLLEAATRHQLPGMREDPSKLRAWTHALNRDACRLAGWLRDGIAEPVLPLGVAASARLAPGNLK